jgi:hypothetical protein
VYRVLCCRQCRPSLAKKKRKESPKSIERLACPKERDKTREKRKENAEVPS